MAIAEMLRVAIIGLKEDADRTTAILQRHGSLQIEGYADESSVSTMGEHTDFSERAMKAEEASLNLKFALDFMDRQKQVKKGALGTFIGWHYRISEEEYDRYVSGGETRASEIFEAARQSDGLLNAISAEIKEIDLKITALKPWTSMTVSPAEFMGLKQHTFLFVSADATKSSKGLEGVLEGLEEPAAYQQAFEDGKRIYGAVVVGKADAAKAMALLSMAGFDAVDMPDTSLPPQQEISRLEGRKAELQRAYQAAKEKALELCDLRPEAFSLYDHFANEKSRYETAAGFTATDTSFVVGGWVRKDLLGKLERELRDEAPTAVVLTREPEEGEDVPVDLINKGIFGPFEAVTRIMGLPKQGSIDPTPLLAVFFFIYFGTCMGDAIYGLIMTLIGLLMLRKLKTAGMGTQLLQLLVVGGIATVVMGVLFGGYFGDLLIKYIKPVWFDPMSENGPIIFLGFSFGMGVVQILFGMGIKAYDNARNGRWLSAIYDQGFWVLLLLGVGLLIGGSSLGPSFASAGKWIAIAGAAGLVLTQGRHHKNPAVKVGSGIVSLYNITSYMSDIVSYSRLFGLGFTSIVIGMVINYLAKMMLAIPYVGYVLFAALLVFGHMFNLFINITGAFIHSSRLQYVEFFGKFADFGGSKYSPFRKLNKYVDIDFKEAN